MGLTEHLKKKKLLHGLVSVSRDTTTKTKEYIVLKNTKQFQYTDFYKIVITKNVEEIFDKSVISSNFWLMYGNSKPKCPPYKLTQLIAHDDSELEFSELINEEDDLVDIFSLQNKNWKETKTRHSTLVHPTGSEWDGGPWFGMWLPRTGHSRLTPV